MSVLTQQLERGLLRLYILWEASKRPISGVDILKSEREHGHELSAGRLYPTLHSLVKKRYLVVEEVVEHGKVHKYHRTSKEGKEILEKVRDELGEPMKEFLKEWLMVE